MELEQVIDAVLANMVVIGGVMIVVIVLVLVIRNWSEIVALIVVLIKERIMAGDVKRALKDADKQLAKAEVAKAKKAVKARKK